MNSGTAHPRSPQPKRTPATTCADRPKRAKSTRTAPFRQSITSLRSLSSPPQGGSHSRPHCRPDLFTPCVHAPESVRKTVPSPEGPTYMTLSDRFCGDTSSPPFFISRVGRPSGHPAAEGSRTAVSPPRFFQFGVDPDRPNNIVDRPTDPVQVFRWGAMAGMCTPLVRRVASPPIARSGSDQGPPFLS